MRPCGAAERTKGEGLRRRLAAAVLLALLAVAVPAAARYGDFDFWGRTWPLPIYVPVWSADAAVCRRIVKALNAARQPSRSLYSNKIFLRWQDHPAYAPAGSADRKLGDPYGRWMEAPFFNDGKPVVALKVIYEGDRFVVEHFYVFDDLAYYQSQDWLEGKLWEDPSVLRPIEPFLNKAFNTFIALPKTTMDYDYWNRTGIGSTQEVNLARLDDKIYAVVRMPAYERFLVLYFTGDRQGHPVCIIGPKKRVRYK